MTSIKKVYRILGYQCYFMVLLPFVVILSYAWQQPTGIDLNSPALSIDSTLPLHNPPGKKLEDLLAEAHTTAIQRGITWKGLDITVGDERDLSVTDDVLLRVFQKQACESDVIAIGHTTGWLYHLASFGTAIYGDYDFVVDQLLKDDSVGSIKSATNIVVTRPGGDFTLTNGTVKYDSRSFPRPQLGVTYLQFLKAVPGRGSYRPIDSFSTLMATNRTWLLTRTSYQNADFASLSRSSLELSISQWVATCK